MLARLKYKDKSCVVALPLNSLLYAALYNQFQLINSILQIGNYFHILIDNNEINPDLPVNTFLNVKIFIISTNLPKSLTLKHLYSSLSKISHLKRLWQDTIKSATYLIHGTASPYLALSLEATDSIWNDLLLGNINNNKWFKSLIPNKLNRIPLRILQNNNWKIIPADSNKTIYEIIGKLGYVQGIPIPNNVNIGDLYIEACSCDLFLYITSN